MDLRPCPFCGGSAVYSCIAKRRWTVLCDTPCGALGPIASSKPKAIAAWNDRLFEPATAQIFEILEEYRRAAQGGKDEDDCEWNAAWVAAIEAVRECLPTSLKAKRTGRTLDGRSPDGDPPPELERE
jgi:Lar family restriction alleviation protein